ncbi:MAG: site-2 protease family protein [Kiritimatiellae bacterium]|nr:site-2 protease family protein [Kiritimatiellia bacterium]
MLKTSYQICTLFGIPIRLDISLVLLFVMLVGSFSDPVVGIAFGIVLLLSIAAHELGHSLTAMAFGCQVQDITLMIIGGRATMLSMPRKAWQECLVALSGPLVSALLAVLGMFVFPWLCLLSRSPALDNVAVFCFQFLGYTNLTLCLFNLLPAFPMDGGRVLRSLLQQFFMGRVKATWVASRIGRFIAMLMALSVLLSIFTKTWTSWYFTRLLIAWVIYQDADREYRLALREAGYYGDTAPSGCSPLGRVFHHREEPPPDDGKAVISPPPYDRWGGKTRVDIQRDDR